MDRGDRLLLGQHSWHILSSFRSNGFNACPVEIEYFTIEKQLLVEFDDREDYGEDRWIGIGLLSGRVVVVVYTELEEEIVRIISLRKALTHERRRYEQYLQNRLG